MDHLGGLFPLQIARALNIIAGLLILAVFILVYEDLRRALSGDGPILQALLSLVEAMAFIIVWDWVGEIEAMTNFLPNLNLNDYVLRRFIWIPRGILFVSLLQLYRALHWTKS